MLIFSVLNMAVMFVYVIVFTAVFDRVVGALRSDQGKLILDVT
jgi:hypothetical protein